MQPTLMIFENENPQNEWVTFEKKLKPYVKLEDGVTPQQFSKLRQRRQEIITLLEGQIFHFYLDEDSKDTLCSEGDFFPDRTLLTGRYYVARESYGFVFRDKAGHAYDVKNNQYRDLYSRDDTGSYTHFLPLDSEQVKPLLQIFITVHLTSIENGIEQDYMGIDFSAELAHTEDKLEFEIVSHDVI